VNIYFGAVDVDSILMNRLPVGKAEEARDYFNVLDPLFLRDISIRTYRVYVDASMRVRTDECLFSWVLPPSLQSRLPPTRLVDSSTREPPAQLFYHHVRSLVLSWPRRREEDGISDTQSRHLAEQKKRPTMSMLVVGLMD
jgi:hypothetical protein